MSIPNWIIEKQRQERERQSESRQQLYVPSPEAPRREEKPESKKDQQGSVEIDFTL
jgi:hypothetical protein